MPKKKGGGHAAKPVAAADLVAYVKTRWKSFAAALTAIVLCLTAVKSLNDNWDTLEEHTPITTHWWVKNEIKLAQTPTINKLNALQIDNANDKKEAASNRMRQWQLEQLKPGYKADTATRDLVDRSIRAEQSTIDSLERQIETLRGR